TRLRARGTGGEGKVGLIGNADWVSGGFEGDAVSEPFEVGDQPSPVISPPRASAHHCACRYAQSSPTCFTSGLLPDGIRHRRVSPARRPFFMSFHKRSIPLLRSLMGERIPGSRIHVAGGDHLLYERGGRKGTRRVFRRENA